MITSQLDLYDDPSGSVLKKRFSSTDAFPDFIKQAERLTEEELNKLPDDIFALVALDSGHKMRKFACVDKGNTALSVIYFLENKGFLPDEAQKTAAANLVSACQWYGMSPPLELQKTALVGAAMGALTMGSALQQGSKDFKKRQQLMAQGVPASQAFQEKASELVGSHVMPYGQGDEKTAGFLRPEQPRAKDVVKGRGPEARVQRSILRDKPREGCRKTASFQPYVDITGKNPPTPVEHESGKRFALVKEGRARYPIDTAKQVERAFHYFEKFASRFSPHERHAFCSNVSRRANELGMKTPEAIAKYGSSTMAKDAGVQIYRRQRLFREGTSEHSLLQEMREKCASIRPEVMAVALEEFDRANNLDQLWDNGLPDPYHSIFGVVKTAEWSFVDGNDTVTETRLKRCARECKEQLDDLFEDEDFVKEFSKNPIQIFDSLPLDSKRIIMRVSQQVEE